MEEQQKSMKVVWSIVDRTPSNGGPTRSYWTRVGVGFINRDGSMNLHLDAIPMSGKLQVREWQPYQESAGNAGADRDGVLGDAPPPPPRRPRAQAAPAGATESLL